VRIAGRAASKDGGAVDLSFLPSFPPSLPPSFPFAMSGNVRCGVTVAVAVAVGDNGGVTKVNKSGGGRGG
jgi:hypothetical protein